MQMQKLTEQYSVSEQIDVTDISQLIAEGVEIIVCNRPDNEAADQPQFKSIENAAMEVGIQTVWIPFSANDLTFDKVNALSGLLKSGKKIHAYCRTGNRSSVIWQEALKLGE